MKNDSSPLGKYIRSLREANALTLRAVEEKTGVSNAYLSQLESGRIKQPSPVVLHKLAELYSVPYQALMEKAGYPVPGASAQSPTGNSDVFARFGHLTDKEEEALLDYLSFLRSRSRPRRRST